MENAFALNVLQKLDHCVTITDNSFITVLHDVADSESRFIFTDTGAYGRQSDGGRVQLKCDDTQ